jgi:hypothetical protein
MKIKKTVNGMKDIPAKAGGHQMGITTWLPFLRQMACIASRKNYLKVTVVKFSMPAV